MIISSPLLSHYKKALQIAKGIQSFVLFVGLIRLQQDHMNGQLVDVFFVSLCIDEVIASIDRMWPVLFVEWKRFYP